MKLEYAVVILGMRDGYLAYAPDVPGSQFEADTLDELKERLSEHLAQTIAWFQEEFAETPLPNVIPQNAASYGNEYLAEFLPDYHAQYGDAGAFGLAEILMVEVEVSNLTEKATE